MISSTVQPDHPLRGSETVLTIDDDARIRRLIEQLLRRYGYQALSASGGQEGLAIFQHTHVDLILLDLSMPGLKGEQVLEQLIALCPEVRVILMTGFVLEDEALSGARGFIYKPFALDDLVHQIRAMLDS